MADAFLIGAGLSYGLTDGKIPLTAALYALLSNDGICKSILERYPSRKIDTVISYLDLAIAGTSGAERLGLEKDRSVLEDAINQACSNDAPTDNSLALSSLLPNHSQIFTFNYDLLLEETLWKLNRWSPRGGYGGVSTDFLPDHARPNSPGINVFKLHGSLNFHLYQVDGAPDLFVEPEISATDFPGFIGVVHTANDRKKVGYGIYPSYLQSYSIYTIRWLWREAFKSIASCDRLFVLGYSFPPEDTLSNFLVDEYLGAKPVGKKIYILDSDAAFAAKRLAAVTSVNVKAEQFKCDFRDATNACRMLRELGVNA